MLYTLRFFSSKCSLFHNANLFGSCVIHILYTECAKIKKKNNSGAKGLIDATIRCEFWSAQQLSSISLYPVHFSSNSLSSLSVDPFSHRLPIYFLVFLLVERQMASIYRFLLLLFPFASFLYGLTILVFEI